MNGPAPTVLLALALALASLTPAGGAPEAREAPAVVEGNTAFALDLYQQLASAPGNLFLSPYSISTALAMTYAGARANTEAEMAKVLHFGIPQEKLHEQFHALIAQLNPEGRRRPFELTVANALWGQQGYKFLDPFLHTVERNYDGALRLVDFKNATEAARQRINQWVEKETNGKIQDLIPPGVLDRLTRLVLTNAIYFKSAWAHQFKERHTKDQPFTLPDGTQTPVPLMEQTRRFGYMETDTFQGLCLPYAGYQLAMYVFLPRKADGLPALEKALTAETLGEWVEKTTRGGRRVHVFLPKFKMTCQFKLSDALKAMGMRDAFSPRDADFSGMNGRNDFPYALYIAEVIHKAFVDVHEQGTEAAAATAVIMAAGAAMRPEEPVVFRADHPFLFLIRHQRTGSILFLGRVLDPTK